MEPAGAAQDTDHGSGRVPAPKRGKNVLLLSSAMDRPPAHEYLALPGSSVAEANVVSVALNGGIRAVTEGYRDDRGVLPANLAVIAAGDDRRSAAAGDSGGASRPANISVASVSSPNDLTGIGIKLSQCLSSWESDETSIAVEIDSLTTLLQFADLNRVFQFVHVLTGRIDNAGAVGFFHLDPRAHDEQTVATLRGLFDLIYEYGSTGWQEV